jgi:hypothetical protein
MDINQENALTLVSKLAAVVEQFDLRCEQTSRDIRQLAQQVPMAIQRSADEQFKQLTADIARNVQGGVEQPVQAYEQRLREAGQQLQHASIALAGQLQQAKALHKQLAWKVAGITLGSLALLWGAGIWLSKHYYDEIRANQVSAELLKAYNESDVTLCGKQLCAKVDTKDKRHGEYLPVRPR